MNASDFRDEEQHMLKADAHHSSAPGPRTAPNATAPEPPHTGHDPAGTQPVTGAGLTGMSLAELRDLRRSAQREEADLSYLRRLLQGRIDILRAELASRSGRGGGARTATADAAPAPRTPQATAPRDTDPVQDASGDPTKNAGNVPTGLTGRTTRGQGRGQGMAGLLGWLPEILADGPSQVRTSARHVTLGTPQSEEYRRLAEEILADVELSALDARTDDELRQAMRCLVGHEEEVSRRRQGLQRTADDCSAEIARRYREGEARVDDLLAGG